MLMSNFLKDRKSVRDYKKKKLDSEIIADVKVLFEEIQGEANNKYFDFILFEEGEKIYNDLRGIGGYAGVMIESPHYIGIRLKEINEESIILASYYTEKLMGNLSNLNLGSCWLGIKNVDKNIRANTLGEENENIAYLVAFGYPKAKNPFINEGSSSRIGVEDIVFKEELGKTIDIIELENRGLDDLFYYVRFAPSSLNSQPWRFILEKDKVVLLLSYENGEVNLMDAGIIMYYFEELSKTIGINNKWELSKAKDIEYENKKYKFIGEFKL
ncbi:MAG: nitroreductase [Tissierellia bacterium]|nr:nitroreductase [Tissierellia bacterium]